MFASTVRLHHRFDFAARSDDSGESVWLHEEVSGFTALGVFVGSQEYIFLEINFLSLI